MITKLFALSIIVSITRAAVIIDSEKNKLYPLSIIHVNDFHARFEETNPSGGPCAKNEKCIGGYARLVSKVKELKDKHKDKNTIYLNAGDNFQGTLWYNIGRWAVTAEFLNIYPADVTTIGNHEFDHGIDGLLPFLENLNTEIVVANMDDSHEPRIQGKYKKSVILERGGRKIGVIGVIWEFTNDIANTEKVKFYNESVVVRKEAELLKEQGVDIIIVLSHCGYDVDQVIAKNAGPNVDVIVGSHSHTFLYNGTNFPGVDRPRGPYPTSVYQESGHRVLIVQAAAYTKYVGDLTVYFDDQGNIVKYEGEPHYLSNNVGQDPEIMEAITPWKEIVDAKGNEVIGSTKVRLSKQTCGSAECNLGNFFADAIIAEYVNKTNFNSPYWSDVAIAIINQGALRIPLEVGNLTYSHLVTMSPFENKIRVFNLKGKHILETLEFAVKSNSYMSQQSDLSELVPDQGFNSRNMLQVSGLRVVINATMPDGQKVRSVMARCQKCLVPRYERLQDDAIYRVAAPNFLADGGDGFYVISKNKFDEIESNFTDIDVSVNYVRKNSPITTSVEGRITILH